MDSNGFVTRLYDKSVEFMNISKEMFEFYRDILGSEVKVTRVIENRKKKVLSATLTNTFQDSDDLFEFSWKLIINQSQMTNVWRRNTNQLDVYDVVDKLQVGDLISFNYCSINYQFKVTNLQAYGIGSDIIYQYQLNPIIEHHV